LLHRGEGKKIKADNKEGDEKVRKKKKNYGYTN
jgi:hypothetical protein